MAEKRRGQSLMDFLVTYGWAILIVFVVICVLFYLGVFNPQGITQNTLTLPSGFTAVDYKLGPDGGLYLDVGNSLGDNVNVSYIYCDTIPGEDTPEGTAVNVTIPNGGHAVVANGDVLCANATGRFFKGKVTLYYTVGDSGITRKGIADLVFDLRQSPTPTPTQTPTPTPTPISIITCPYTISTIGNYNLSADLGPYEGTCITITADASGSQLNCNGHTIYGQNYIGTGIYLNGVSNTTISNCIVQDFYDGIKLNSAHRNTISSCSTYYGNGDGLYLVHSDYNNITTFTADTNSGNGVYLYASENNRLTGLTSTSNGAAGIYVYAENLEGGITDPANNNYISGFTSSSNSGAGVVLTYPINITVTEGAISGNTNVGMELNNMYNSTISGNTISGNNVTSDNFGIVAYTLINCSLGSNIISGQDYGIYAYANQLGGSITGNQISSIEYDGIKIISGSALTVNSNTVSGSGYCGINVTQGSGSIILSQNQVSNSKYGIVLENSVTRINLTSNTVTCAEVDGSMGMSISNTFNGRYVSNTISGCRSHGVYMYNSNGTLTSNSVTNNVGAGFYVQSVPGNPILQSAHDFTSNIVSNNNAGFSFRYVNITNLTGNTISSNSIGIDLEDSGSNRFVSNVISESTTYGVWLSDSDSNYFEGNSISEGDGWGIVIHPAESNTFTGNDISYNAASGVDLYYESSVNTWTGNTICSNDVGYSQKDMVCEVEQTDGTGNSCSVQDGCNIACSPC